MTEKIVDADNIRTAAAAELAGLCAAIADDRKAEDIIKIEVGTQSVIADFFVVCTGNSEPHVTAISNAVGRGVREKLKRRPRAVEGNAASRWIILDYGDVVVHIFTPDTRELYQLESLWGDAPSEEAIKSLDDAAKG